MNTASDLLEPTDGGILEDLFKKITRNGEKRLMLAVLESATEDFQKYVLATDKRGMELFQDAEAWILDSDNPSLFSFNNICEYLALDPDYLRHGFMRWKTEKRKRHAEQRSNSAKRRAS
jgi:hypothetical protein